MTVHGGLTVSSSAISAFFSVNICGGAWRPHCVFFCYLCCFLWEYLWQCMEDSLCLLLLSLLFSLGIFVVIHGGLTVSSSAISAVFSVNICGSAWRTQCVFFCYLCCFLCEYLWRFMEDSLCLRLSLLFSL